MHYSGKLSKFSDVINGAFYHSAKNLMTLLVDQAHTSKICPLKLILAMYKGFGRIITFIKKIKRAFFSTFCRLSENIWLLRLNH